MPNNEMRILTFAEALREATDQLLEADNSVYIIGEGVPDPKTIFGTTKGLVEKYGPERVMDMPVSENGMTGIILGSALVGFKPILVHQRIDFSIYALDQVINNLAKWYSMFGGQQSAPVVIRMIIGQGWGQGNQHSQNLEALYAHIPGLKVVMPSNAADCKGLLISAVQDKNPVIFIEHRWLHNTTSHVPEKMYEIPIGKGRIAMEGKDVTIVSWSYWLLESLKAAEFLKQQGISVEVIDLCSLRPLDFETIKKSVLKTKKILVVDGAWRQGGFAAEIITRVCEDEDIILEAKPCRVTYPDFPSPSTPGLTRYYYPTLEKIFRAVSKLLGVELQTNDVDLYVAKRVHDVPDANFKGPF
jgi:acetoin:2,6-dichlorophenolindophenol oxidoreductase subunit beta